MKLLARREKKVGKHIEHLYRGLEDLLPLLEECKVKLGIENLPTWEAIPTELEAERLVEHFASPHLGCWHDMGHARIRENLGLSSHLRWLERLKPALFGIHIHDVVAPGADHVMPPEGEIEFEDFRPYARMEMPLVIEPTPRTPAEAIARAREYLLEVWR